MHTLCVEMKLVLNHYNTGMSLLEALNNCCEISSETLNNTNTS